MKNNLLILLLLTPFLLWGQTITGTVQDMEGNPILRAEVRQKDNHNKTFTGEDGAFKLPLNRNRPKVLLISHECVENQEIEIKEEQEHITIKMTVINANYDTINVAVLVKAADTKIKVIKPAVYEYNKNKTKKVLKERAVLTAITTPAEYKSMKKKVLVPIWYNDPMREVSISASRGEYMTVAVGASAKNKPSSKNKRNRLTYRETNTLKKITKLTKQKSTMVVDESSLYDDPSLRSIFKHYRKQMANKRLTKAEAASLKKDFEENIAAIVSYKKEKLAGILTAGEINDFAKWTLWNDLAQEELTRWSEEWDFLPKNRYAVQVNNSAGVGIVNAKVYLLGASEEVIWEAKTDNTGKAELWHNLFSENQETPQQIEVAYKGETYQLEKVTPFENGVNFMKIPVDCETPLPIIDLAFVVDGTASMEDEIEYLKEELKDVINKTKRMYKNSKLNTGSVFYRDHDHGNNYLTKVSRMHYYHNVTLDFIREQGVRAGKDTPEAVTDALEVAVDKLRWRKEATTRLMFLILDAPPHDGTEERLATVIKKIAAKGIRVIPIVCSGAHIETEYLMRAIALATNGSYTFVTDHSGIGGLHLKPTTDAYKVETLNSVMVRLIRQFSGISSCTENFDEAIPVIQEENEALNADKKNKLSINFFPNPTSGVFSINAQLPIKEVFVTDVNGKLLIRKNVENQLDYQLDISDFAAGIYVVRCNFGEGEWGVGRLVVVNL